MPKFIVTTQQTITSTYEVICNSSWEARQLIEDGSQEDNPNIKEISCVFDDEEIVGMDGVVQVNESQESNPNS